MTSEQEATLLGAPGIATHGAFGRYEPGLLALLRTEQEEDPDLAVEHRPTRRA